MLAVIGGTGLYAIDGLSVIKKHDINTPFGKPSAAIIEGQIGATKLLFLARHGQQHNYLPHEVNYRANIYALKMLGAKRIIGFSAVGSLQQQLQPGHFVIPHQYFDNVKGNREKTFFGGGVAAHVSTAMPVAEDVSLAISQAAKQLGFAIHTGKTYACVDGPRLGTKAESLYLKNSVKADVVGMTNVPEVFLANEAQIDYCVVGIVTDYDCWLDDEKEHVTVEQVIARFGGSLNKAKQLLTNVIEQGLPKQDESKRCRLKAALLTPLSAMSDGNKALVQTLLK